MTEIEKYYDHNPRHFKFERRCDDFEPDANEGDRCVFGTAVAIAGGLVCWLLIAHVVSRVFA